jgi:hypothetical protein
MRTVGSQQFQVELCVKKFANHKNARKYGSHPNFLTKSSHVQMGHKAANSVSETAALNLEIFVTEIGNWKSGTF